MMSASLSPQSVNFLKALTPMATSADLTKKVSVHVRNKVIDNLHEFSVDKLDPSSTDF